MVVRDLNCMGQAKAALLGVLQCGMLQLQDQLRQLLFQGQTFL